MRKSNLEPSRTDPRTIFKSHIAKTMPLSLARHIADHEINYQPGQRVLFETFGEPLEDDLFRSANGRDIYMEMMLYLEDRAPILSDEMITGKHLAGGIMLTLDPSDTHEHGDIFVFSYHVRDDYTLTYAKRAKGKPGAVIIIAETVMLPIEDIFSEFSDLTGVELPYA
jgi:hypothetical protein